MVCAALVVGLSACGGDGPTTPTAMAPTPLDGVLCDVLPTDLLTDALGFDSYTYAYYHHPVAGGGYDRPGYYYVCMLQSDYTTWSMLEIHYEPDDTIPHQTEFGHKVGPVEFDRVPESFPNAEPVNIDGQDGQGWAWAINNAAYVFWLYPDGHSGVLGVLRTVVFGGLRLLVSGCSARVRPRWGCGTPVPSGVAYDCRSVRSTRQHL